MLTWESLKSRRRWIKRQQKESAISMKQSETGSVYRCAWILYIYGPCGIYGNVFPHVVVIALIYRGSVSTQARTL